MDMFGGLKRTSSRLTIAAAVGLLFGAMTHVTPAMAADLGGDCCADLEERVAELEATTVRKGTKKVSLTISGWVTKAVMFWDDGDESNIYIVDKFNTLSSHIKFSGSGQIAPGWTAGYLLHVEFPTGNGITDSQIEDNGAGLSGIRQVVEVLQSAMFLKSDQWGTLTLGKQSHPTDNLALLPDLSGTIIESNAVIFEGNSFFLRPEGGSGTEGLSQGIWGFFLNCTFGAGPIGTDCDGVPIQALRYDTPTFAGFSVSTHWGEDDMWGVAGRYAGDLGNFKLSAAIGYSETTDEKYLGGAGPAPLFDFDVDTGFFQVGASALHVPTGLFVYGLYSKEDVEGSGSAFPGAQFPIGPITGRTDIPEIEAFYFKAGIKRTWTPFGATVLFGEYGEYEEGFSLATIAGGGNACNSGLANNAFGQAIGNLGAACLANGVVEITDSTVERWGLGIVQEVDSAALRLYARWQHLDLDVDFITQDGLGNVSNVGQGFEDLDIYMVGGTIFF